MAIQIKGYPSGNMAEVDADGNLTVVLPKDLENAGYAIIAGEPHDGVLGIAKVSRHIDLSPDYRTRVGLDSLLWQDIYNHGQFNVSKYLGVESTMTKNLIGGRLAFNNGNSVAAAAVARVQTYRTFPLFLSYALYLDFEVLFTQDPVANNVCEFGLGFAATTATPTDGVFFRLNGSGQLRGVINNNGTETTVNLGFTPASNISEHYLIVVHNDSTEFWINDSLYGVIDTPPTGGGPSMSASLPLLLREYNSAITALAQRMEITAISVSLGDMSTNRLWATTLAGMGQSSINQPDSIAAGQTANYANSAAPASATLSNTAAGYTTLGGQFQFAAVAGAETDYALFAFQVPVAGPTVPGKNLLIRGIRIETFNMGAAVATTPTLLQWALGVGATAVTMATADSVTTGARGARRLGLGIQSLPVAAAIGAAAAPVDINLDAPIMVEAGTFVHILLKMPVGTATASQIIRGLVTINGVFE